MKGNLAEECLKNFKTKKISLNFDMDTLEFIDDFSKITNTTRTTTIMSIIGFGMKASIESLESSWEKMKKEGKYDKEKIGSLLKKLEKFKKKWKVNKW